ncbi:hypothetical protein P775_24010 [Puniceibacterium antarcticum]|uniref:DUF3306 domain-containing protein n=1 Tax=Puniceibacterium antarcticum TaxID=1206336 RepID=A0A2G8R7W1_9RHOB|nr:DUF3306 domain-containing protein [Puniceibacterium antarcticum]PIL17645.1 hypothetical protein P775_24010 [Puniceibacterium antarcticum]
MSRETEGGSANRDTEGGFWSRRRARVAEEEAAEVRAGEVAAEEAEAARLAAEQAEKSDAEILADFNLPDPDDLIPGQDIAGFMHKAIPEHLRRRALRRLWRLNPVLAVLDGLNDYDGDFSNAATDAPGVKTSYQVGKGLLRHVEALARAEADKVASESAEIPEEAALSVENAVMRDIAQEIPDAAPASTTKVVVLTSENDEKSEPYEGDPVPQRRMRFTFETENK